jgi:glycosyltransferase involved in cell wall biosynthesis
MQIMTQKKKINQKIILIIDVIFSSILVFIFILWLACIFLITRITPCHPKKSDRRFLCMLTLGIFEEMQKKGISHMFFERDENGYFDHVCSIHLFTNKNQCIKLSNRHTILEFGGNYNSIKNSGFTYLAIILTFFESFPKIYKIIIHEKNCILRATDPYIDGLYVFFLGKIISVPYCISIHSDFDKRYLINKKTVPILCGSHTITKIFERFIFSHTPMILPIRESLREYVLRHGAKPDCIRIIPHGVDISKFERLPKKELKKDLGFEGKNLIVFAGRLTKDNYVEDIIEAAKKVVIDFPDSLFLLLGDGPEKSQLSRLIHEYQLQKNVILMGFLPNEKVIEIRSIADVNLCLMGGFSLIEAGLSGNPVISYDVEWHYELVKNGETGYLLKEGDIESLIDSIITLLKDPKSGKRLGEQMKKLVAEKHSLTGTTKIKIDCYEELFKIRC